MEVEVLSVVLARSASARLPQNKVSLAETVARQRSKATARVPDGAVAQILVEV
jgi:hypothetical protein